MMRSAHSPDVFPKYSRTALLVASATFCLACGGPPGAFPLRTARWVDDDRTPIAPRPAAYWSPLVWDAVDHTVMRPVTRFLAVDTSGEAVNVNAVDEVPDSTWYQNRLALRDLASTEVGEGACAGHPRPDEDGVWTVTAGKSSGASPGFVARAPDGNRYMVKIDGTEQPEISTAGDAIGTRLFWAAGYNTACDYVVGVRRESMRVDPTATTHDRFGHRVPFTTHDLDTLLVHGARDADGRYRLGISLWLEGTTLGPFHYEGVRDDDPNDRVPHEDRRDLRAARVLCAWTNHWDSREANTLTTWIPVEGPRGYLMHYFIDFSDIIGGYFPSERINRQLGYSYYFDPEYILEDFLLLGLIDRPWQHTERSREAPVFGYFTARGFQPDAWRGGYPNPAFDRMTERDAAWMARILARMRDPLIAAAVTAGRFSRPEYDAYAVRTLAARRDAILERYLTRLSPLTDVTVNGRDVCVSDRARASGVYTRATYAARMLDGFTATDTLAIEPRDDGTVCTTLPPSTAADAAVPRGDATRYRRVEIAAAPESARPSGALTIALYDVGPQDGYVLAGVER